MRILGFMIALVAMTASTPALASDYSTDRHFTQGNVSIARAPEARPAAPAAPEVRKATHDCDCSCARRAGEESSASSRAEPGGH